VPDARQLAESKRNSRTSANSVRRAGYPRITYLEETYYHRLNPADGFGIQRVYTDNLQLNETMAVHDGDVVLVPRGHHPCGVPHGFEMYYLNVMAGPLRKWRFLPDPNVEWILKRDT
jgi:5-deoxy-glucuronate isomerase